MNPQCFRWLDTILAKAEVWSRGAVWVAGGLMLASVGLICFDVVTRKLFHMAHSGSNELSGYAFAISTSWALAFGMLQKINVRVDVLYRMLPVRVSALLDLASVLLMGVFVSYLTYYAAFVAIVSWEQGATANTSLGTPLWIPQGLWVIGMVWMCVVLMLMLLRAALAFVSGDYPKITEICGQRSAQDEAEEEARAGQRLVAGEAP